MIDELIERWKTWQEEGNYEDEDGVLPQSRFEEVFKNLSQNEQLDDVLPLALALDGPVMAGYLFEHLLQQSECLIEKDQDRHIDTQLFVIPFKGPLSQTNTWLNESDWAEHMIECGLIHPSSSVAILGAMSLQQAFQLPLSDLQRWLKIAHVVMDEMQGFTLYGPGLNALRQQFSQHMHQTDPWGDYVLIGIRQTVKTQAQYDEDGFMEGLSGDDETAQHLWTETLLGNSGQHPFVSGPTCWTLGLQKSLCESLTPPNLKNYAWHLSSQEEGLVIRSKAKGFERRILPHAIANWVLPFLLAYWVERGDQIFSDSDQEEQTQMTVVHMDGKPTVH